MSTERYNKLLEAAQAADANGDQEAVDHFMAEAKKERGSSKTAKEIVWDKTKDVIKGGMNVGAHAVIGALSTPVAAGKSAFSMGSDLLGGSSLADAGANAQQKIDNTEKAAGALADKWAPPTKGEGEVMSVVGKPLAMANSGLGQIGEAAGSVVGPKAAAFGKTVGENLIPDALTLAGGSAAAKSVKPFMNMKPKLSQVQDEIRIARRNGFMAPPVEANPSVANHVATSVANPEALNNEIALKNSDQMTKLAKADAGIPEQGQLNKVTVDAKHAAANKPYEAIRKAEVNLMPDEQLGTDLANADGKLHDEKATYPAIYKNNPLEQVRAALLDPGKPPTPGVLLNTIAKLRKDASRQLRQPKLTNEEFYGAMSMKNVATVLEDFLDRRLSADIHDAPVRGAPTTQRLLPGADGTPGTSPTQMLGPAQKNPNAGLVDAYRAARTAHAKLYNIEDATNLVTGRMDPALLARIEDATGPFTGEIAKITHAHRAMGHVVKNIEAGTQGGLRAGDMAVGHAAGGVLGAAAGLAFGMGTAAAALPATVLALVTPVTARKLMSSGLVNKWMSTPSPKILEQIKQIDPKVAAYLAAQSADKTNQTPMKDAVQ